MESPYANDSAIRKVVLDALHRYPSAPVDVVLADWCRGRGSGPNTIEATRVAQIYAEELQRLSEQAVFSRRRWWRPW